MAQPAMSPSTQDLIPQVDLGNTFGALLIGVVLAAMLVNHFLTTHRSTGITLYKLAVCIYCLYFQFDY
ncbi:hypothetical protein EDB19DRAFT_1731682 [Suillus lakei]|nr:hypothetical protein EDB19DRAFT_1731682 [Suillus lakei]